MIHQDPYSALNPIRTIGQILADPLGLRARQLGASNNWLEGAPLRSYSSSSDWTRSTCSRATRTCCRAACASAW